MKSTYLLVILTVIFSLQQVECEIGGEEDLLEIIDKKVNEILNQVDGKQTIRFGANEILKIAGEIVETSLEDLRDLQEENLKERAEAMLKEASAISVELEQHGRRNALLNKAMSIKRAANRILDELEGQDRRRRIKRIAMNIKEDAERILELLETTLRKRVDNIRHLLGNREGKKTVLGFLHALEKTSEDVKEDVGTVNTNVESIQSNISFISNELDGSKNLIMGTEVKVDDIGTTIEATKAAVDLIDEKVHRMERVLAENAKLQEENSRLQRHLFRVVVGASPSKFLRRHRRKRV